MTLFYIVTLIVLWAGMILFGIKIIKSNRFTDAEIIAILISFLVCFILLWISALIFYENIGARAIVEPKDAILKLWNKMCKLTMHKNQIPAYTIVR